MSSWERFAEGVTQDFADLQDVGQFLRLTLRLIVAAALGGILGYERARLGKAAGLRTHMLVVLGAALMVLAPQQAGMTLADLSRVIQGVVTGIGFLGAGAILKLSEQREIRGLTTAAGIWLTAGVGLAAGLGHLAIAILGVVLGWPILTVLACLEHREQSSEP